MSEYVNVNITDSLKLKDSFNKPSNSSSGLKGIVSIYKRDKNTNEETLYYKSNNLIVYRGRTMALSRMVGKDLSWSTDSTVKPLYGMKDKYIAFFGIGSGGAASNNPQNPLAVSASEHELISHGNISGGLNINVNNRTYKKFDDTFPKFLPENEIINNSDIYESLESYTYDGVKRDSYLLAEFQTTLETYEANGTDTQVINEAGLFLAESDSLSYDWSTNYPSGSNLELFAKNNFPSITKSPSIALIFKWYIYF